MYGRGSRVKIIKHQNWFSNVFSTRWLCYLDNTFGALCSRAENELIVKHSHPFWIMDVCCFFIVPCFFQLAHHKSDFVLPRDIFVIRTTRLERPAHVPRTSFAWNICSLPWWWVLRAVFYFYLPACVPDTTIMLHVSVASRVQYKSVW